MSLNSIVKGQFQSRRTYDDASDNQSVQLAEVLLLKTPCFLKSSKFMITRKRMCQKVKHI